MSIYAVVFSVNSSFFVNVDGLNLEHIALIKKLKEIYTVNKS